jgi:hypothetical protein
MSVKPHIALLSLSSLSLFLITLLSSTCSSSSVSLHLLCCALLPRCSVPAAPRSKSRYEHSLGDLCGFVWICVDFYMYAVLLTLLVVGCWLLVVLQQFKPEDCSRKTQSGDNVMMHYRGRLVDGSEFDASYNRGTPFGFKLGAGQVIRVCNESCYSSTTNSNN